MTASLTTAVVKDGNSVAITGGVQILDLSGTGAGPNSFANILVDGVAGSLRAQVTAANALKTDGSAVNQPVTEADGANTTLGAKADAKSTATDTTAVTIMQVLKQISASVQAPPSSAVTNAGTFAVQAACTEADGANTTLGAKGDAKSTATDTTAITIMQVLKQISASVQAPPSQAVTNAGTFVVQAACTEADGANTTLGAKADAKSTATDTTAITIMQVLKQISASVQAPPSQAVTNAGTFAVQAAVTEADGANVTLGAKTDAKSTATDGTSITVMQVLKQISASVQAPPSQAVTNAGTFATQPAGGTASGAALTASPLTIGGLGKTANPTAVADGQVVNTTHDKLGKMISVDAIRDLKGAQKTSIVNTTTETSIVASGGAGVFNDVYAIILANKGASTTFVDIRDNTAGTIRMSFEVPTLETRGIALTPGGAYPQTTANNVWSAQCATATANLEVTVMYVKNT